MTYKSALLSGLVFPGLGYLPFKLYKRALAVIIPSCICLVGLVQLSLVRSQVLMDRLLAGEIAADLPSMLIALQQTSAISIGWQDYSGYGFMLLWAVSVYDAYKLEQKAQGQS
jgi:hypothetical protein